MSPSVFSFALLVLVSLLLTQTLAISPFVPLRAVALGEQPPPVETLSNNTAVKGSVQTGAYTYYAFTIYFPSPLLSIVTTPTSGDPDLYVSLSNPYPSTTNYDYCSQSIGVDEVTIDNAAARTYYIAVFGFVKASFSIVANATSSALADASL